MIVWERIGASKRWAIGAIALLSCVQGCGGRSLSNGDASAAGSGGSTGVGVGAGGAAEVAGAAGDAGAAGASGVNTLEGQLILPQQVDWLWVDAKRIYWLADPDKFGSCDKTDCSNTVLSYGPTISFPAFAQDHVYWRSQQQGAVLTCPTSGCTGQSSAVSGVPYSALLLGAEGDYVYWSDSANLHRCLFSGCTPQPVVAASVPNDAGLVLSGSAVFWSSGNGLYTAPKDGSSTIQPLVSPQGVVTALAVVGPLLYWMEDKTRILSCPINGCAGDEILLARLESDASYFLHADSTGLYWKQDNAVHFCALPGCTNQQTVTTQDVRSFAVDDQYVYWNQNDAIGTGFAMNIRRTAKPTP